LITKDGESEEEGDELGTVISELRMARDKQSKIINAI
jgi:hypothetical protein